ncbi:MAG: hypothetical protein EB025_00775 [Chitinophagaceae bacterium]|jgi:uncharacterized protein (UPF0333 family)|nr:hypothetical protein [Chitinophagia bacterium]NDB52595.1 hypothetical protein [Chitinophagaceae bacterium]NDE77591.1 hypothetical protein [Chitinophagaceae bacterium]
MKLFLQGGVILISIVLLAYPGYSQRKDSTAPSKNKYELAQAAHSPKKAAIRSAILPGLGQIYNKKYWKLPIVYGALGASGAIFFYNLTNYQDTRFAYRVKYNMRVNGTDSLLFNSIKSNLKPLPEESLRYYRNQFRRDIDYSALFFLLLWGLNVMDAAVDAHLKTFDVGPDLSLQLKAGYSEMANTNGLSVKLRIGK